ncbi:hypothetical protein PCE1_004160 [Barthelona sp. PCE]
MSGENRTVTASKDQNVAQFNEQLITAAGYSTHEGTCLLWAYSDAVIIEISGSDKAISLSPLDMVVSAYVTRFDNEWHCLLGCRQGSILHWCSQKNETTTVVEMDKQLPITKICMGFGLVGFVHDSKAYITSLFNDLQYYPLTNAGTYDVVIQSDQDGYFACVAGDFGVQIFSVNPYEHTVQSDVYVVRDAMSEVAFRAHNGHLVGAATGYNTLHVFSIAKAADLAGNVFSHCVSERQSVMFTKPSIVYNPLRTTDELCIFCCSSSGFIYRMVWVFETSFITPLEQLPSTFLNAFCVGSVRSGHEMHFFDVENTIAVFPFSELQ